MADLEYEEICRQPYTNVVFSSGFVHQHEFDTVYLRLSREGEEPTTILLRPDEAAALAWCPTGALWSERMRLDAAQQPAESVFVSTTPPPESLPEGARKYIRDVPAIATFIHKGVPPSLKAAAPDES